MTRPCYEPPEEPEYLDPVFLDMNEEELEEFYETKAENEMESDLAILDLNSEF